MRPDDAQQERGAAAAPRAASACGDDARGAARAARDGEDAPLRVGENAAAPGPRRAGGPAPRRWLWRAEHRDGSALQERDAQGNWTPFHAIRREELRRFALVEPGGRPAVVLDCATGVLRVHGRALAFGLRGVPVTGRSGAAYTDVIHFKEAHTDWRAGRGAGPSCIDAYCLGYKVALAEAFFEAVLRLDARTARAGLRVKLTPRGAPLRQSDLEVLVEGVPVRDEAAFDAALQEGTSARWSVDPGVP